MLTLNPNPIDLPNHFGDIRNKILINFRISVDFRVVFLVSRSDGETGGVCDSKWLTNQMHNAHYSFLYFNELLFYEGVRGSLISFKHENCKIESLLQIWKRFSTF